MRWRPFSRDLQKGADMEPEARGDARDSSPALKTRERPGVSRSARAIVVGLFPLFPFLLIFGGDAPTEVSDDSADLVTKGVCSDTVEIPWYEPPPQDPGPTSTQPLPVAPEGRKP
jgi:hypothetical protein